MKILLTGGAGYIGSHTAVELLNNNYEVIIVDNFYNSNMKAIESIKKITGRNVVFLRVMFVIEKSYDGYLGRMK